MSNRDIDLNIELKRDKIGVGLGAFGYNFGAAGLMTFLTIFYTDTMLIPAATVAAIMLGVRIIDAMTDLLLGFLIDRTKSKYGKMRPWILWMVGPAVISVAAMYYVPNFSTNGRAIYAFATYVLMEFCYLTCMALPIQGLCAVVTSDSEQRLKISQIFGFFNTLAAVFINLFAKRIMTWFGGGSLGFFYYFGTVGIIGGICMLLCFFLTKERTEPISFDKIPLKIGLKAVLKNKYWWNITLITMMSYFVPACWAAGAYYCIYWLGGKVSIGSVMSLQWGGITLGVLAFIPITKKIGKMKSTAFGLSLQALGSVLLWCAPSSVAMIWISTFFRSFGVGAFSGTRNAMRADVVEYGEWKSGVRTEGMIFSGASFGEKVGSGIGSSVVAALLAWGGYIAKAPIQTEKAMLAIKYAFILCPFIGSCSIIALLLLFDLEKKIPQIRNDLEERRKIKREC